MDSVASAPAPTRDSGATVAPPRSCRQVGPRLEALIAVVLILVYLGVMLPSLTRFPPLNNDEGREAQLSWVASGLQPGAERMNAYRGFPTWGTGGLQGATTVLLFWLFGLREAQRVVSESLLRRWGEVEDVAPTARFLVSPAASFITCQTLAVNGGRP